MSSELTRIREGGFREARKLDGVSFTVNGGSTTYTGTLSSGAELKTLTEGGFMTDYDKALDYLPSEIALAVGDKVTAESKTYRVERLNGDGAPIFTAGLIGIDR